MKNSIYFRFSLGFILMLALFSPTAVLALGDGKKHFKQGMKHEVAEEWDKAAEEFALAVSENPKNPEYRLHYIRSLFNASQMFMKKGRMQADEKDYAGAYISFRKAYAYDPVNELAKSEMERVLRLQQGLTNGTTTEINGVKLVQTGYKDTCRTRRYCCAAKTRNFARCRSLSGGHQTDDDYQGFGAKFGSECFIRSGIKARNPRY